MFLNPPSIQRVLSGERTLPIHSIQASRHIEAACLAQWPGVNLVQRAGQCCARLLMAYWPHCQRVWVIAGTGHNGADGLQAAIALHQWGKTVHITQVPSDAHGTDAMRISRQAVQDLGLPLTATAPDWPNTEDCVIVDALLGLGISAPPRPPIAQWIQHLNAHPAPVLAIDLPSGLNGDTGYVPASHAVVNAHVTLSLLTLKPGLLTGQGRDHSADLWFTDLGCSQHVAATPATAQLIGTDQWPLNAGPRPHQTHKGSWGSVVVMGGASGMQGAAHLAARSALSAGAGRVYLCALAADAMPMSDTWPELMIQSWEQAPYQQMGTVTVCGCGANGMVADLLETLLTQAPQLVLDADALNALSSAPDWQDQLTARQAKSWATILTPHPLEAARLLGCRTSQVQSDRLSAARELSRRLRAIVVLKGSGTVIASPDMTPYTPRPMALSANGNARLATAGTGDVLAGMIAGQWAQGHSPFDAACLAVSQHGHRAHTAQLPRTLRASDLL